MAKIIGNHEVRDFKAWKSHYEADESRRNSAGINTIKVYQGKLNPNKVFIHWDIANLSALDQMLADPELGKRMVEAGVTGPFDYCVLD